MKKLKFVILFILSIVGTVVLFFGFMVLIGVVQEKLFLPQDYIMWIDKYPLSKLVFVYEGYLIIGLVFIFQDLRESVLWVISFKNGFIKKHKRSFLSIFAVLNIVLIYAIIFNVTVITNDKLINYTFSSPQGKEYAYNDISKIDTGVYGKRLYLPFTHSKGEFYYIIQLKDGTKIDLTQTGGTKYEDIENGDPRFIIEKLDIQLVNMGIDKVASMENFKYCTEHLDKIYTDKIRNVLLNIE